MAEHIQIWEQLQRIETLLVQAGARRRRELASAHLEEYGVPRHLSALLSRVASGLDAAGYRPEAYQARYPFASVEAIQDAFDELVEAGLFTHAGDEYILSERGRAAVRAWVANMGAMIGSIPVEFAQEDVERLHAFDHQILAAMQAAERPHPKPIFTQRLNGIQPDYDPPQAWHHWQLAWSMIAFHEDEEEFVRGQSGLEPLEWFLRRNLWFVDRRPWIARARTAEQLAGRVAGYAPLPAAEEAVGAALAALEARGWLAEDADGYRLSSEGLAAADIDEASVDAGFISAWPPYDAAQWQELDSLSARFTAPLEKLMQ